MTLLAFRASPKRLPALFLAVAMLGGVIGGTTVKVQPTEAAAVTRTLIASSEAVALIEATTGEHLVEARAVGNEARLVNAALPFSDVPLLAARPVDLSGADPIDHRRALLCLTQAIYYEAGFEPAQGRRAVAQVVLNRMRHPAFPKSVCGVVYQGARQPVCQFSFVCDGSLYRPPAAGAWKQAQAIAEAALDGFVEKSVGAATHYHADYVAPYWAPRLAKISAIGTHIFYRWPGAWGTTAAFTGRYIGEPVDPAALRPPLRQAVMTDGAAAALSEDPVVAGPPVARAPNDVGGLLDPSKGWSLNIPSPSETGSATKVIAEQQATSPPPPPASGPALASR